MITPQGYTQCFFTRITRVMSLDERGGIRPINIQLRRRRGRPDPDIAVSGVQGAGHGHIGRHFESIGPAAIAGYRDRRGIGQLACHRVAGAQDS